MASGPKSIVEALSRHQRERPDALAFTFLADGETRELSLTFGEIAGKAAMTASAIRRKAPDGGRVMLMLPPGLDFITCLMGCFMAGVAVIPTPLPAARAGSRSARRFMGLIADARPDLFLTTCDHLSRVRLAVQAGVAVPDSRILAVSHDAEEDAVCPAEVISAGIALIQYTSGSTARPKGVVISQASLAANLRAIGEKFQLDSDSIGSSWLPPYHDMGLIGGILEGIWSGYRTILMDAGHFLQRPMRWLEAVDRYRVDVSGGANFAYDLCSSIAERNGPGALDLHRLRLAFSGAEPVRAATIDRFSAAFAASGFQRRAFYPCYGLAEATLMAAGPVPGHSRPLIFPFDKAALREGRAAPATEFPEEARRLVSCGTACRETDIRIVTADGVRTCADGEIGEIWLAGPGIADGYLDAAGQATVDLRRILPGEDSPRFHATGDLGFFHEGELFVSGRRKDLIIIRGRNHMPSDIEEAAALSHPALALDAVAAFPDDDGESESLIVACEIRRDAIRSANFGEITTAVRTAIAEQSGIAPADVVILKPGSLSRTTSGKIMRHACREAWRTGTWDVLAAGAGQETGEVADQPDVILRHLISVVAGLAGISPLFVATNRPLSAAGLDSLRQVEFALRIEQAFGVSPGPEIIDPDMTLAELARRLGEQLPQRSATNQPGGSRPVAMSGIPLTPRQKTFLAAGLDDPKAFAETLVFRVPADFDSDLLAAAIARTCRMQGAFAHRFRHDGDGWVQEIDGNETDIHLETIDATGLSGQDASRLRDDLIRRLKSGIDLAAGPLVRFCLLDRGAGERSILLGVFHHLVIDAVSLSIWVLRLQSSCSLPPGGHIPADIPVDYSYSAWQQDLDDHGRRPERAAEIAFWRDMCGQVPPVWPFPDDAPEERTAWRTGGARHLPGGVNRRLLLAFPSGMERCGLVLAAIASAWQEAGGEPSLLVRMESHGRARLGQADPLTAIGWFACEYPIRIPAIAGTPGIESVGAAVAALSAVPHDGQGYGLLADGRAGQPAAAEMVALARPLVTLQYRGNIDESFRQDARLPVIGVVPDAKVWQELAARIGDEPRIRFSAGLKGDTLQWSITIAADVPDEVGANLLDGMERYFRQLAGALGES